MARRDNPSTATADEATEAQSAPEGDAAESTSTTEAPAEAPRADTDLTAFTAAIESAISQRDESTGVMPETVFGAVVEAYRALPDTKARNDAKKYLAAQMRTSMEKLDAPTAKSYMTLQDRGTASAPSATKPKEPVDPTQAYVEKAVSLRLALNLIPKPEGLAEDWQDKAKALAESVVPQVTAYQAYLDDTTEGKTEPTDTSAVVKAAFKLAAGRASGGGRTGVTRTGPTRNIANHITEAFAEKASGDFLKISEIKKFKSAEYGDDSPSAGALSARLFPSNGKDPQIAGIKPGQNAEGDRGAFKV